MSKVLVLGAGGRVARHAVAALAADGQELTLFARQAGDLDGVPQGATVVEGDVLDREALSEAVRGQDVVYANLAGPVDEMAEQIVSVMTEEGVDKLIFVASLGIYHELPEPFETWNESMIGEGLGPFRRAARTIESSDLDYTIVRAAWMTDADEVDYEVTGRDEQFRGTEVSRRSLGAFVAEVVAAPQEHHRTSEGVSKPGTDGDKPAFM